MNSKRIIALIIVLALAALIALTVQGLWDSTRKGSNIKNPPTTDTDIVNPTQASVKTSIGAQGDGLGVSISPTEVITDSRCAVEVQCVWAGTVTIKANTKYGTTTKSETYSLNTPVGIGSDRVVTLTQVLPVPHNGVTIVPANYEFTFEVKKK